MRELIKTTAEEFPDSEQGIRYGFVVPRRAPRPRLVGAYERALASIAQDNRAA